MKKTKKGDSKLYKQGEEDMEERDEEEREEDEDTEKSDLSEADLEKSLQLLSALTDRDNPTSRKDALLAKAQDGTLEKSEREELFDLLGGKGDTSEEPTLASSITKGFTENDSLQKALDVSDYLDSQHDELCKSLTKLSNVIEKSDGRQHEFNMVLAKSIVETGKLVKAVADNLEAITNQPLRAPKSKGLQGAQPLHKGFAGKPADTDRLSKAQILGAMEDMLSKGEAEGNWTAPCGEDLTVAVSKYEQFNQISKALLADVQQHLAD